MSVAPASRPSGNSRRHNASPSTTTGASVMSAAVKTRPAVGGTAIAAKNPGDAYPAMTGRAPAPVPTSASSSA